MSNSKSLRRTFLLSTLAIIMCASMLVGTTFAWFTDTASTAVNLIQSGTLQVDIVDKEGQSITQTGLHFVTASNDQDAAILWEPGATFLTNGFQIKNIGNLALKYKLTLNGVQGDAKLLEAIEFSVVDEQDREVDLDTFVGHLETTQAVSQTLYIKGHMKEEAGNEYQGLTLSGLGLTVIAGQLNYEFDSNGNDYDENAPFTNDLAVDFSADATVYRLSNAADLLAFAKEVNEKGNTFEGKTIKLTHDVYLTGIDWLPIGQEHTTQFKGVFDGCNHTIFNLSVDATVETREHYAAGLFGWVTNAVIKNVNINGATIRGHHYSAALVGYAESTDNCEISNCHVTKATVSGAHHDAGACGDKIGAIVGFAANSGTLVKDCSASNCAISGSRDAGQITGSALSANIVNCTASNVSVIQDSTSICNDMDAGTNIREELIGLVTG